MSSTHRPYPAPSAPFVMHQRWHDLLFMHWRVPAAALRARIPRELEIDTFNGEAWLAIVPFRMSGIRPRYFPGVPWLSAFAELNVRTYVTANGKPGVWFFSLDAANSVAVSIARTVFKLPYFNARMRCDAAPDQGIDYASTRTHRNAPPAEFAARYRPTGTVFEARPGSLENFLTARYCLYTADAHGRVFRGEIEHPSWPLQPAEAQTRVNTMAAAHGFALPDEPPHLLFARDIKVQVWPLAPIG